MAFIDYDFYINVYKGAYADPNDFDLYSERACDIIDGITNGCASQAAKDDEKTLFILAPHNLHLIVISPVLVFITLPLTPTISPISADLNKV